MAGNLDVSICTSTTKSVPRDFSWIENYKLIYYMAWKLSPDQVSLFHKNPSCYSNILVLNFILLSAQYNVGLHCQYFLVLFCCYVVTLLFSCSTIPWYPDYSASIRLYVPPVFRCSASVPVLHRCSVFRSSVFRCSGVPGFTVCLYFQGQETLATIFVMKTGRKHIQNIQYNKIFKTQEMDRQNLTKCL